MKKKKSTLPLYFYYNTIEKVESDNPYASFETVKSSKLQTTKLLAKEYFKPISNLKK